MMSQDYYEIVKDILENDEFKKKKTLLIMVVFQYMITPLEFQW